MKRLMLAFSLVAASALAADAPANPFLTRSTLPFQAPPFDKIKDADFQPAIEEGMTRELAEAERIANNTDAPTFENTIVAMEKTGDVLRRVSRVFFGLSQSNTNPTLQKAQSELAPKLAAHNDAIRLNPKLFARVKAVYDERGTLNLDPEQKRLVERYYRDFVRGGAQLSDDDKATLRALNKEQSQLTTEFRKKVLAETNAQAVVVDDIRQLAGLPDADIAAAGEAAKGRG
ncbi:MAG TPA: dipeptidyl carboxypeptidase II, partial [Thermoanaerobaculia bacterium]|nr:dipeptidyl carboxypeptidase II [Thermoanaerobaculia bacterium]